MNGAFEREDATVIINVALPGNGGWEPREFTAYTPLLVAGIRKLFDTVEDRAVAIRLERKKPGETVGNFRRRDGVELIALGRKAARWCSDNFDALSAADPKMPSRLNDRAADVWESLLAIADQAGGKWPEEARKAAQALSGEGVADDESLMVILLRDVRSAFVEKGVDVPTKDSSRPKDRVIPGETLAAYLATLDSTPWPEWKHDKPITKNQVSRLMKTYRLAVSATVDIPGGGSPKGYRLSDFEDAFERYLPPLPLDDKDTCSKHASENAETPEPQQNVSVAGEIGFADIGAAGDFKIPGIPSISGRSGVPANWNAENEGERIADTPRAGDEVKSEPLTSADRVRFKL